MSETTVERRRAARHPIQVLGWMCQPDGRGAIQRSCVVSKNLSPGGGRFTAPVFIAPEGSLHISLQLHPAGGPLECDGEVCWSQTMDDGYCHFGVRFRGLGELEGARLWQFLEAN